MKKNTGREVLKKLKENGYLHEEEKEIIDEIYKKIKEELEGELEDLEKENDKLTKQIYPDDFIAWWIVVG